MISIVLSADIGTRTAFLSNTISCRIADDPGRPVIPIAPPYLYLFNTPTQKDGKAKRSAVQSTPCCRAGGSGASGGRTVRRLHSTRARQQQHFQPIPRRRRLCWGLPAARPRVLLQTSGCRLRQRLSPARARQIDLVQRRTRHDKDRQREERTSKLPLRVKRVLANSAEPPRATDSSTYSPS